MTASPTTPVTPDDLHAFVDGRLDPAKFEAVLAHLQAHPEDARRVAQWQADRRALRGLHREIDPGPVPAGLLKALRPPSPNRAASRWAQAASVAGALVLGAALGHWWPNREAMLASRDIEAPGATAGGPTVGDARPTPASAKAINEPAFVREARVAHAVFVPERRHPVEVSAASDDAHLMQWLSRRLGVPLRTPDLATEGYRLLGGRLLPGQPHPRAQFMYEDAAGQRLTLYVVAFDEANAPGGVAFSSGRDGDSETFYWIDGRLGYALSAPVSASNLQRLARSVHTQLGLR